MTVLLARRALSEYVRRPLNLALLAVVPVVFVILSAGALHDFARILGGTGALGTVEAASAGWAAAILAATAGFFHVSGSRAADRRLVIAGARTLDVVVARIVSALALAAVAATGALVALFVRTGIDDAPRAIAATALFGLIYLSIGLVVGALVRSEMNGSLLIIFIWMFDVFFGPAMGGSDPILRIFPLHFPTEVVIDVASGHAGPLGDLGISLLWAVGALSAALIALVMTTRLAPAPRTRELGSLDRAAAGLRSAFREYRRNAVLWVLLIGVPIVFITMSFVVTPDQPTPVELLEGGRRAITILSMINVHGSIMASITAAFLAGLTGLFVVSDSAEGDRRLTLAGFRPREVLAGRLGVIVFASLLTTGVALGVTALDFTPNNWLVFAGGTAIVALTYAMIGVLVGSLAGRLGGLYIILVLPFLDLGVAQNPMFDAAPPGWASLMPAHGAIRVMLDGAFTNTFDEIGALGLAFAWLTAITLVAVAVFHHLAAPQRG